MNTVDRDDNVIFPFGTYSPAQSKQSIVEMIENILDRARAGEIVGFAYAALTVNERVKTMADPGEKGYAALSGAINALHHDVCKIWLGSDE